MSISVRCPNPSCGKSYSVAAELAGKRGRCKACGQEFRFTPSDIQPVALAESAAASASRRAVAGVKPEASHSAGLPSRIGRFEVRAFLGGGAFGSVYRAYDPQLDREVALKVPQVGVLDKPRLVERFLVEAKAAAKLRHPHIVPVYDAGQDDGRYYIASAYIAGQTLSSAIDHKPLEFREAANIVRLLADGLQHAHSLGILHRDVKSANVLLDSKREPHLTDFGLARLETSEDKLTQDGAVLGTPAYMSPEQASGKQEQISAASDQYSLGVVLYELLTGQTPFGGPPAIVIFNVLHQEPPAPRTLRADVPRDLETICLKALAKEPSQRYRSCEDMAEDLRRWLADEPITARRLSRTERLARWCRREPVSAGLSASLGIIFLLGLVGTTWQAIRANYQRNRAASFAANEHDAKQELEQKHQQLLEANAATSKSLVAESIALAKANRSLYGFRMQEAQKACLKSQHELAIQELESLSQTDAGNDLRGWEWRFLHGAMTTAKPDLVIEGTAYESRWSHDGTLIGIRTRNAVNIYDARTGKLVQTHAPVQSGFDWNPKRAELAVLNPDSVVLRSATESKTVETIPLPPLPKQGTINYSLAWNPDGTQLAIVRGQEDFDKGLYRGHIAVIDRNTNSVIWEMNWTDQSPVGFCWSPDGRKIALGFESAAIKASKTEPSVILVDAATGMGREDIGIRETRPTYLCWSNDGDSIYCGSRGGGSTYIWSIQESRRVAAGAHAHRPVFSPVDDILGLPHGRCLALWNLSKQHRQNVLWGRPIEGMSWSRDGQRFAVGRRGVNRRTSFDSQSVELFDLTRIRVPYIEIMNPGRDESGFSDIAWSPQGEQLAAVTNTGSVWMIDPESGASSVRSQVLSKSEYFIRWSPTADRILLVDRKSEASVVDVQSLQKVSSVPVSSPIQDAEWDGAGNGIWVRDVNNRLSVIDLTTQIEEVVIPKECRHLGHLPRSSKVFVIDDAEVVSLIVNRKPESLGRLEEDTDQSGFWAISHDGRSLLSAEREGNVNAHHFATQNGSIQDWTFHGACVALECHPTEDRIAVARSDGTTTIVDLKSGFTLLDLDEKLYSPFDRSRSEFRPKSVSWSSNGRRLAAAGYCTGWSGLNYGMVCIWSDIDTASDGR